MQASKPVLLAILALSSLASVAQTPAKAKTNHEAAPVLAATPPMGWNSWNFFARNVNDQDIRNAADQMISTGMKDAGYIYVNIDDTWEGSAMRTACCIPIRNSLT